MMFSQNLFGLHLQKPHKANSLTVLQEGKLNDINIIFTLQICQLFAEGNMSIWLQNNHTRLANKQLQ